MAKFGRYEFGKAEPTETYEGDRMTLDKGYVRIWEGQQNLFHPHDHGHLVAAIYLDKSQSVREIKPRVNRESAKQKRRRKS
ncbi:MAG: hypothetical protein WAK62_02420 [Terriglobales bacterium]